MGLMDRFRREPVSRVHMVNSVDQFVAGEQYDIPVEVADRFIIRGYATGSLSREYSAEEHSALHANHQVVSF
jgi:phosphoribosylaminoimidazole-succinocarboxamide synthase